MTNIKQYAEIAVEYQKQIVCDLDRILVRAGLDEKLRLYICSSYLFQTGTLHDGARLNINGSEYFPKIVFAQEDGSIEQQPKEFSFHDHANNSAHNYFDSLHGL